MGKGNRPVCSAFAWFLGNDVTSWLISEAAVLDMMTGNSFQSFHTPIMTDIERGFVFHPVFWVGAETDVGNFWIFDEDLWLIMMKMMMMMMMIMIMIYYVWKLWMAKYLMFTLWIHCRIVVNSLRWTYILCDSWCISYWIDPFQFVRWFFHVFPLVTNIRFNCDFA